MSELICTCQCGGAMFYRHLHAESCVLSREGDEVTKSELQILRDERDRLQRALARATMALRYYAKTAISARAVEALEKMEAALTPAGGGKE